MRRLVMPVLLLMVFFLFPLQVFIIGVDTGIGIQGAVYRYQVTLYGNSLIPVTQDIMYIVGGTYSGKTALSVILWTTGTVLLALTTCFGLVSSGSSDERYYNQISLGLAGSCLCYLFSCIAQYGFFFHGPAGTSIPFGIAVIAIWVGFFRIFPDLFSVWPDSNS